MEKTSRIKRKKLWAVMLLLTLPWLLLLAAFGSSGIRLPGWSSDLDRALWSLRGARVLTGFVVGMGLSCAGVVFQGVLRNPLADPYLLGVSSGAGLGAVSMILSGLAGISPWAIPAGAFAGGILSLFLVCVLARGNNGRFSIFSMILAGVIISAMCSSLLLCLVALAPREGLHNVMWWMLGSLQPASWPLLTVCAALILAGCAVIRASARRLDIMALGHETAHHLGINPARTAWLLLSSATLIAAAAVALSGMIGFVGLIIPHVTRRVFGPSHAVLLSSAALTGGLFLATADAMARTVISPLEIPIGVVTALLGGPFFLWLLLARHKEWMT